MVETTSDGSLTSLWDQGRRPQRARPEYPFRAPTGRERVLSPISNPQAETPFQWVGIYKHEILHLPKRNDVTLIPVFEPD